LRSLKITANVMNENYFGERIESLLFAAWLMAQSESEVSVKFDLHPSDRRGLARVELELEGSKATIERDRERCVLATNVDGHLDVPEAVTRSQTKAIDQLIVRVLKQPSRDRLLPKILPVAIELAKRVA
jgi:hypothetical protein